MNVNPKSIEPVFSDSITMMMSGMRKKIASHPSPGRSKRYGSPPFFKR